MSKYNKIQRLEVHGRNGIAVYEVGQREYFSKRLIAEIKDIGCESQAGNIFTGYDVLDEDGKCIARFENGVYTTFFILPEVPGDSAWRERAEKALQYIEWNGGGDEYCEYKYCPYCRRWEQSGHSSDCELALLLERRLCNSAGVSEPPC